MAVETAMRVLLSVIILLPLLIGTSSPGPGSAAPTLENCPFEVDPNLVVGKLLGWTQIEVGQPWAHTRTWSDPDGDSASAEIVAGPEGIRLINKPRITAYTILWTPPHPMTTAVVVRVTDKPVTGQPQSQVGTLLVQVVPKAKRRAGSPCGGPPP
jgi:hypothetical protein